MGAERNRRFVETDPDVFLTITPPTKTEEDEEEEKEEDK